MKLERLKEIEKLVKESLCLISIKQKDSPGKFQQVLGCSTIDGEPKVLSLVSSQLYDLEEADTALNISEGKVIPITSSDIIVYEYGYGIVLTHNVGHIKYNFMQQPIYICRESKTTSVGLFGLNLYTGKVMPLNNTSIREGKQLNFKIEADYEY